jgi:hypothetical protein
MTAQHSVVGRLSRPLARVERQSSAIARSPRGSLAAASPEARGAGEVLALDDEGVEHGPSRGIEPRAHASRGAPSSRRTRRAWQIWMCSPSLTLAAASHGFVSGSTFWPQHGQAEAPLRRESLDRCLGGPAGRFSVSQPPSPPGFGWPGHSSEAGKGRRKAAFSICRRRLDRLCRRAIAPARDIRGSAAYRPPTPSGSTC